MGIKLIVKADLLPEPRMAPLLDEAQQLCNIDGKSIVTAKASRKHADSSNAPHTHNFLYFAVLILTFSMILGREVVTTADRTTCIVPAFPGWAPAGRRRKP
jgi:hypothetical protein